MWTGTSAQTVEVVRTAQTIGATGGYGEGSEGLEPVYLDRVVDADEYRVGPGDRLTVNVIGPSSTSYNLTVTPEAMLVVPSVGVVDVAGLSLTAARRKLIERLRGYYPSADLAVTLTTIRRFRISVIGAVSQPGLHVVTANTRASEVLGAAGMGEEASRRSVMLLRGRDTLNVDLTAFERLGRRMANPYLVEGDALLVPARDPRWGLLNMSGAVNASIRLEYAPGDRVGDLLDMGYGLSQDADTTRFELWRFQPGDSLASRVMWPVGTTYTDWRLIPLAADDNLIVRALETYHERRAVTITGEVRWPGAYVVSGSAVALTALIDSAGGFTLDADLTNARIIRATRVGDSELMNRLENTPVELRTRSEVDWLQADALSVPGRVSTDFVALFRLGETRYDIMLTDGDMVIVPAHTGFVNVIGRVAQPGLVVHKTGADLNHYLDGAGGYGWRANRGGTFLIKGASGAAIKQSDVHSVDPGDIIIVPTKRPKSFWRGFKESLVVAANLATIYLVIDQATR